jgi:hypothetical protein
MRLWADGQSDAAEGSCILPPFWNAALCQMYRACSTGRAPVLTRHCCQLARHQGTIGTAVHACSFRLRTPAAHFTRCSATAGGAKSQSSERCLRQREEG